MPTSNRNVFPWHACIWRKLAAEKLSWPHAVLIKGASGIGKRAFAQTLARGLLCAKSDTLAACDECTSCRWMDSGIHPDFMRIIPENLTAEAEQKSRDPAKKKPSASILIEQIRELNDYVNIPSQNNAGKVIILYPAEILNLNAANALLKMLEEPPPTVYFVLITHSARNLTPTLSSRCRKIALPGAERKEALAWLLGQGTLQAELGLAQAGDAPTRAAEFDEEYWSQRALLLRYLTAADFVPLAAAEALRRYDVSRLIDWLQKWIYDLFFLKVAGKIRYYPDCAAGLAETGKAMSHDDMLRFFRELSGHRKIASHPLNAQLFIEHLMLSYSHLLRSEQHG